MKNLYTWGFNPEFEKQFLAYAGQGFAAARVVEEQKGRYQAITAAGTLSAVLSGKLRHEAVSRLDLPAVGDWVAVEGSDDLAVIHGVLPRQSQLIRHAAGLRTEPQIVAANLTTLFVVMALNQDFNLRRLERYLVMAQESAIRPVVVLTKADLAPDWEAKEAQAQDVCDRVPVLVTSCLDGRGLSLLRPYLGQGETVAVVGSSGAGKSTLANRLLGEERQLTREIRDDDGQGRHTTTARTLILLAQGGVLLDTPGMRELQLWEGDTGLTHTFREIEDWAGLCRFRDCAHADEPGCAVQAALREGRLEPKRLENHRKLARELAHQRRKHDRLAAIDHKRRWKQISRDTADILKRKGRVD